MAGCNPFNRVTPPSTKVKFYLLENRYYRILFPEDYRFRDVREGKSDIIYFSAREESSRITITATDMRSYYIMDDAKLIVHKNDYVRQLNQSPQITIREVKSTKLDGQLAFRVAFF